MPKPVNEWWWDSATIDHAFAEEYARQDTEVQAELGKKLKQIVTLQNELASVRLELEASKDTDGVKVAELEARIREVRDMLDAALAKINAPTTSS